MFRAPAPPPGPAAIRFAGEPRSAGCGCGGEVRCGCGSLLARVVDGQVELKCRRCKQTWTLPLEREQRAARGGP